MPLLDAHQCRPRPCSLGEGAIVMGSTEAVAAPPMARGWLAPRISRRRGWPSWGCLENNMKRPNRVGRDQDPTLGCGNPGRHVVDLEWAARFPRHGDRCRRAVDGLAFSTTTPTVRQRARSTPVRALAGIPARLIRRVRGQAPRCLSAPLLKRPSPLGQRESLCEALGDRVRGPLLPRLALPTQQVSAGCSIRIRAVGGYGRHDDGRLSV
ncbi:hypothetical protein LX36DRAFT_79264 [Colletotrichum falcatum]|nr:hypothetical protein LX36DRAFT_79264 [Colletotrichum falcatum]